MPIEVTKYRCITCFKDFDCFGYANQCEQRHKQLCEVSTKNLLLELFTRDGIRSIKDDDTRPKGENVYRYTFEVPMGMQ